MQRPPPVGRWLDALRESRRLALGANAVIYFLERVQPYSTLIEYALQFMERGLLQGMISTVVEAEIMVKPLRERDQSALEDAELFIHRIPNLVLRSIDSAVAKEAARIRADTQLSLPDAMIIAAAVDERCDTLIGNDRRLVQKTAGLRYLYLSDYIP